MDIRNLYWKTMYDFTYQLNYIDEYLDYINKIIAHTNVLSAIASSASIACWAIWKQYDFIWSTIVAISQVFNVLVSTLNLSKKSKSLNSLVASLLSLQIEYENGWFYVSENIWTDEQVNQKLTELKIKYTSIFNKFTTDIDIGKKEEISNKAYEQTDIHYKFFFTDSQNTNDEKSNKDGEICNV